LKRLSTGVLAALFAAGLGLNAVAAPTSASHGNIGTNAIAQAGSSTMMEAPPANFGSPPSGQVPILYNDHHVYSKPDTLKQGRVLAALVRGGTVLIPLRSMFEQMGATVSYDAASKTVDVSKPGADVKVTVGKPEVIINGESRPLDVPPILWQGNVLVPVRVISEGMGAYVQWVPDKQLVVVRYIPPTPTTPEPTVPPTAPPPPVTAPPTPTPSPTPYLDLFVAGDYLISPKVYDEFNPGTPNGQSNGFSWAARAGAEFGLFDLPWMLEGDYRNFNYPHNCSGTPSAPTPDCYVTTIGGTGSTYVPYFQVRSYDFDGRLGIKVLNPRIYIGLGYIWRGNNAGYPQLTGIGFGAEKLPDLDQTWSVYGSIYYYSNIKGSFVDPTGISWNMQYNALKYQLGVTYALGTSPLFIEAGILGERDQGKLNTPGDFNDFAGYVGLGLKF
jgi:hypothetical protein